VNKDLKSFFIFIATSLILLYFISTFFVYSYFNLSAHLSSHEQLELFLQSMAIFTLMSILLMLFAKKFLFPILNLNAMVLAQRTNARLTDKTDFFNDEISFIGQHLKALKKEVDEDNSAIEKLSLLDSITGVNNRYYFFEFGERIFKLAKRNNEALSLIIFEIDNYEEMISKYGQAAGDKTLSQVAKATQEQLRKSDMLARFTHNEFVILLPNTPQEGARVVAKNIQATFDSPEFKHFAQSYFTVSISISQLHKDDIFLRDIVHRSSLGLVNAKEAGSNQIELN